MIESQRTLVLWWDDWAAVAAGCADTAAVVVANNRVVCVSHAAAADGVRVGMRRREAQSRCPTAEVVSADPGRDARAFEPVVAAVETICPRVEIVRPGVLALASRGPSRYFGGDDALAELVQRTAPTPLSRAGFISSERQKPARLGLGPGVGIADDVFPASLAARQARGGACVVPPGADASAAFLAPFPVDVLGDAALADLLRRLGLRTLGAFADLDVGAVLGRFGAAGAAAHRQARGLPARPLAPRDLPPDLVVQVTFDPPADTVDRVAFAARALAVELADGLRAHGLTTSVLSIEVETEHGERRTRCWRSDGALNAGAVAERVRWQAEGWLADVATAQRDIDEPTAGITLLRLSPDEVHAHDGSQQGLWGGSAEAAERVARAVARVQGLLGPEAATTAVLVGGRSPAERVRLIPWGDARECSVTGPWPGQVPSPAPALVHAEPVGLDVLDADGRRVSVSGRGEVSSPPAVVVGPHGVDEVTGWAGPWPAEERWWDPASARRRARVQVACASGAAHLCVVEDGRWWLEASY
ncbi:MAG TPA: hypothetical protein VNB24_01575 [Acidimicrobiales bacterium]|nr:hypothetical protein [Acidimicrobiales bacterium]